MDPELKNILKRKHETFQKEIQIKNFIEKRDVKYNAAVKIQRWFRKIYLKPVSIAAGVYCARICLNKYNLIELEENVISLEFTADLLDDEISQYVSFLDKRNEIIEQTNLTKLLSIENQLDFKIYFGIDLRNDIPKSIKIDENIYYLNKEQISYIEKSKRRVNHNLLRILEYSRIKLV